jgi:hypothetical protein
MRKIGKRLFCFLLVCVLTLGMLAVPAGASGSSTESTNRADKLVSLHLFQGTTDGYKLDNRPTRLQGLIMLIRLLGQEDEALAYDGTSPFTDLNGGEAYVAYAYNKGLTKGTSATTFTPGSSLSAASYVTFLLRALGYDDTAGDFTVGQQLAFAASISMMTRDAASKLSSITMNRGDMVDLSYAALTCNMKGQSQTLAQKLQADGVFTEAEGQAAGVLGGDAGWVYTYVPHDSSTVSYQKKTVSTSGGSVTAHVLTVNTKSPRVTVKTAMVNNTVGATAPFSSIVQNSGATAVINGNFFASYSDFKAPIGHVMVNGEFLYGNAGVSSLGITKDGDIRVGRPALFTRIQVDGSSTFWAAYEINVKSQISDGSVLYTPAYGKSVAITNPGYAMTVTDGIITGYQAVSSDASVAIPSNGYVVYMGPGFTSTSYFQTPSLGSRVSMSYYLNKEDEEGFTLDDMVSVVSGAPRLVQDGAIVTTLEAGFTESRFTTMSSSRTAIGVDGNGKLILVSVPSATIQQMRELMLALGCVDAFNLDGGASCGMYYNGSYLATPGRELTVTLQVFVS